MHRFSLMLQEQPAVRRRFRAGLTNEGSHEGIGSNLARLLGMVSAQPPIEPALMDC
jgi:hypothetical protein